MELGPGVFEFFDENVNRYVCCLLFLKGSYKQSLYFLGVSILPSPSSTFNPLPISAVLRLMTSLLTISAMMSFGKAQKNLSSSLCSRPCIPATSSSRSNWKIIKSKPLPLYLMVNLGTNLGCYWVDCLALVKCKARSNTAVSSSLPVVVRAGMAGIVVSVLLFFVWDFWHYYIVGTSSVPSTPAATPKKNLKAFASSRTKASTLWFDRKQPSCLNFTDDSKVFVFCQLCATSISFKFPYTMPQTIHSSSNEMTLFLCKVSPAIGNMGSGVHQICLINLSSRCFSPSTRTRKTMARLPLLLNMALEERMVVFRLLPYQQIATVCSPSTFIRLLTMAWSLKTDVVYILYLFLVVYILYLFWKKYIIVFVAWSIIYMNMY